MLRELIDSEKMQFEKLAIHPLQSYEWGEFRKKTGVMVKRFVRVENGKITETAQITLHRIPKTTFFIGYWPKGRIPSVEFAVEITKKLAKEKVIVIKMEPNILLTEENKGISNLKKVLKIVKGKSLFTKWSFWIDLTKTEEQLLAEMKQKTRYNTRLAEKKGVRVTIDNSDEAFEEYWRLTEETTKRQGFYAHTRKYHWEMFRTLTTSGVANLFKASFEGKTLACWIIFEMNGVVYYPYGASTREDRNVFASNLMMWEVIKWAKKRGNKLFDLWGSPGPDPKETDPWIGFHRFKEGFGARLVEFVGTYDIVLNIPLYRIYTLAENLRWGILRFFRK